MAPLVMLPGTLCDGRLFEPLLARLPVRPTTIVPLGGCDTQEAAVRVLAAAPRRFALLGFSLGGIVALEVALAAPERVAGLALIDSNIVPVDPTRWLDRRGEAAAAEHDIGGHVGTHLWNGYVAAGRRDDADLRALLVAMARDAAPGTLASQTELALSRRNNRDRLAELTMPVLVLGGSDDGLAPPPLQQDVAACCRDAELAIVEAAGHFAPLEQPAAVAAAVAAWLARVDAAIPNPLDPLYDTVQEAS